MVGTICSSWQAITKAGANVSATLTTEYDDFIEEAEGYISAVVKYDLIANWGTVSGQVVAPAIEEYCARSAAVQAIGYDMSGYTSRVEAEDMINVHLFRMNEIKEVLEKADVQDFIGV